MKKQLCILSLLSLLALPVAVNAKYGRYATEQSAPEESIKSSKKKMSKKENDKQRKQRHKLTFEEKADKIDKMLQREVKLAHEEVQKNPKKRDMVADRLADQASVLHEAIVDLKGGAQKQMKMKEEEQINPPLSETMVPSGNEEMAPAVR